MRSHPEQGQWSRLFSPLLLCQIVCLVAGFFFNCFEIHPWQQSQFATWVKLDLESMPLRKISGSDTGSEESWEPQMQDFHHHHHQYHHQYYHQHQHQKIVCAIVQTDITLPPQIFIFILKNNRGMQKKKYQTWASWSKASKTTLVILFSIQSGLFDNFIGSQCDCSKPLVPWYSSFFCWLLQRDITKS